MTELEKATRNYLLNEHISLLNDILHKCDLKMEMQYHTDIENAFKAGANWQKKQFEKIENYKEEGWYSSGDDEYIYGISFDEPIRLPVEFYIKKK